MYFTVGEFPEEHKSAGREDGLQEVVSILSQAEVCSDSAACSQ